MNEIKGTHAGYSVGSRANCAPEPTTSTGPGPTVAAMAARPRTPVWASALAIGAFQVIGTFGAADNQPERKAVDVLAVVLVLVGPAFLAWRDRHPLVAIAGSVVAADAYVALGYPYGPVFVSVVVAFFAAVLAGRRRPAWFLAGAAVAGFELASVLDSRSDGLSLLHLGLVAGWLAVVLSVAEVARVRREQAEAQQQAAEDERRRREGEQRLSVAQELHDVLAHNISLINVQASVALHLLDQQPEGARPALAAIKEASSEALSELRSALDLLRGTGDDGSAAAPTAPAPRLADLDGLVAGVRAGGLDVTVEGGHPPAPLPAAVELAAYRIVQESLTNVTRYARARAVRVRLAYGEGVTVEVTDDGVGGGAGPGRGITGMRERAAALGGSVDAGPAPGGGFRVLAHLPVRPA